MTSTDNNVVHLHVHSHFSLLDGLPRIHQLVEYVKEQGMPAVALTDHGVLHGAVEFYKQAHAAGIKPIIGVEAYVAPHGMHLKRAKIDTKRYHLPLLAETTEGYQNLLTLVTKSHLEGFYYKPRIDKTVLRNHAAGLIGLSGCLSGEIPRAILDDDPDRARDLAREYSDIFGDDNFFIELQVHPNEPDQQRVNDELKKIADELDLPLVATNDAHYLRPEDAEAQDILICVQTGKTVDDDDRMTLTNDDYSLLPADVMRERFADTPDAIENTVRIAERCNVELPLDQTALPAYAVPNDHTPMSYLRELCEQNIAQRYGTDRNTEKNSAINERLDYELGVIEKTGFATYFLIVQDFVTWAKEQDIAVGPGRGSAAGSIVSYLLHITDIDPLRYNLLFERFLDPSRNEMPDIDLDFADTRRDEVIDYVRDRYGNDHVAQIITFGTMGARAAIRDVGRALGYSYGFCDQTAKMVPFGSSLQEALDAGDELKQRYDTDPEVKRLVDAAQKLEGVARHTSTHAAGVVITPDPLTEYVPLQYAAQNDRAIVTQYEMNAVEKLGLLKMDFLGLKNLTIIERTLKIVQRTRNEDINVDAIPLDDRATFELLQQGDTTGVFQLESSGMRRYLKQLKPTEFEDIIAMVALYRPGPLETGMVNEYIQRKHGKKDIEYLHPDLKPILKSTYGVLVYQEQLMQLARDLGGFTLSEADVLRKAVGKKIKSLLDEQRGKLIAGMIENGIDETTAHRIWDFIEPFARYGFNRSHSAAYATISYQTAYLKANYTPEFMTALMTSDQGDVEAVAKLVEECRTKDIPVLPPDVNESMEDFTHVIEDDKPAIRFGLGAIKNLGSNVVRTIDRERQEHGPFGSLGDFIDRLSGTDVNRKSLESLIKAGAMDQFGDRALLLANIESILAAMREKAKARQQGQAMLFDAAGDDGRDFQLPEQNPDPIPNDKKLRWERQLLGLYLSAHPLDDVADRIDDSVTPIGDLATTKRKAMVTIVGLITDTTRITTKKGDPMLFVTVEDRSGRIEAVVFPRILEKYASVIRNDHIVTIVGKLSERNDRLNVLCEEITPFTKEGALPNDETEQKNVTLSLPATEAERLLPTLQAALASLPRGPYGVVVKLVESDGAERLIETRHAVASPDVLQDEIRNTIDPDTVRVQV